MSSNVIDHKLKVFISSRCGGKYSIARKALKKLLESTGLVETYVFETEPACSANTVSSYLNYIDESNLCIFLVDNKDGVTPPILSEEKRAKDKKLRLLYIFCDEEEKNPTSMQNEIKVSLSQKYDVVHEFSDISVKAYDSVMQDIVFIYKIKDNQLINDNNSSEQINQKLFNTETLAKNININNKFPFVLKMITDSVYNEKSLNDEEQITKLERLLWEQLKNILFLKKIDKSIFSEIYEEVLQYHSQEIHELLFLRFKAQEFYYNYKFNECLEYLKKAIKIALDNKSIPTWITLDIAIDIRFIVDEIYVVKDQFSIDNLGQKYIDDCGEPIYYPYLDRQVGNMYEEIAKRYHRQLNISPYSDNSGGINIILESFTNAFCIAEIYGSIAQCELTRNRLISIYAMLCYFYENHNLIKEYIRLTIINRDKNKLDSLIRTYNQSIEILNENDLKPIIDNINNITNSFHQIISKYLLICNLGYYMDDISYQALYNELMTYALKWADDDERNRNIYKYIFYFFIKNTLRSKNRGVINFIKIIMNKNLSIYYSYCFDLITCIDYSTVSAEEQNLLKEILITFDSKEKMQQDRQKYLYSILYFCKNTNIPFDDLEKLISQNDSSFYNNKFLLEIHSQNKDDLFKLIRTNLEKAQDIIRKQDVDGHYEFKDIDYFNTIYDIISLEKLELDTDILNNIIDVIIETLASNNQLVITKLSVLKLLQLVYFKNIQNDIWKKLSKNFIDNIALYSSGRELGLLYKDSNYILFFQYNLFISNFDKSCNELLLEKLYEIDSTDTYNIIKLLEIINDYLKLSTENLQDSNLILGFLYYCILMSKHKEQDIKYQSTNCLLELAKIRITKKLTLMHLSNMMNTCSVNAKITIIKQIRKIQNDDSYIKQIINKGKSDCNYLVRYMANLDNISND